MFQFLYAATESDVWEKLVNCIGGPLGCVGLAWFIAGLVVRYREIGAICSGDYTTADGSEQGSEPYAWKSGHWINIYYVVIMWFFIAVCACGCCIGICATVAGATQ